MTEVEGIRGPDIISVTSEYADIDLSTIDVIMQRLRESDGSPVTLINAANRSHLLPGCIDSAFLEATRPRQENDVPDLYASVGITPEAINDYVAFQRSANWADTLAEELLDDLQQQGLQPEQFAHDFLTAHVRLDHTNAVSIKITSSLDGCAVELQLEQTDQLDDIHGEMRGLSGSTPSDPSAVLRNFAQCLGISIDAIISVLGDEEDDSQQNKLILDLAPAPPPSPAPETTAAVGSAVARLADMDTVLPPGIMPDESELLVNRPGLNDLTGLHYPRERLGQIVEIFQDPHAANYYNLSVPNILLHGEDGVGKRTLIEALATDINASVMEVRTTDYLVDYSLSTARRLQDMFEQAQATNDPRVVLFSHFETIGQGRGALYQPELKAAFLNGIDTINRRHPHIVIVATVESGESITVDPDLLGKGKLEPIKVAKPNEAERYELIWHLLVSSGDFSQIDQSLGRQTPSEYDMGHLYDDSIDIETLVKATDGYTIKQIKQLLEHARYLAYLKYRATGQRGPVTKVEIEQAIIAFQAR